MDDYNLLLLDLSIFVAALKHGLSSKSSIDIPQMNLDNDPVTSGVASTDTAPAIGAFCFSALTHNVLTAGADGTSRY
jgi:hypothetical protein